IIQSRQNTGKGDYDLGGFDPIGTIGIDASLLDEVVQFVTNTKQMLDILDAHPDFDAGRLGNILHLEFRIGSWLRWIRGRDPDGPRLEHAVSRILEPEHEHGRLDSRYTSLMKELWAL